MVIVRQLLLIMKYNKTNDNEINIALMMIKMTIFRKV